MPKYEAISFTSNPDKEFFRSKKVQQWLKLFYRALRRWIIEQQLGDKKQLENLSSKIRACEENSDVRTLTELLFLADFVLLPEYLQLAQELLNFSRQQLPFSEVSIVLTGSVAHGGSAVRSLFQNYEKSDLDWGILYKRNRLFGDVWKIMHGFTQKSSAFIADLGRKRGIHGLHSCNIYNPKKLHAEQLYSVGDAEKLFQQYRQDQRLDFLEKLLLYFQPSFPLQANVRNRSMVLEALRRISVRDPKFWKIIISDFTIAWERCHYVKYKYFPKSTDAKTNEMFRELSMLSASLMRVGFSNLLISTKHHGDNVSW